MEMTGKKKQLTPEQASECQRLKSIFSAKRSLLGITQEAVAERLGITQGAVAHYLNGRNALNLKVASVFADMLQVQISEFSPDLDKQRLSQLAQLSGSNSNKKAKIIELLQDFAEADLNELEFQIELIRKRKNGDFSS